MPKPEGVRKEKVQDSFYKVSRFVKECGGWALGISKLQPYSARYINGVCGGYC